MSQGRVSPKDVKKLAIANSSVADAVSGYPSTTISKNVHVGGPHILGFTLGLRGIVGVG